MTPLFSNSMVCTLVLAWAAFLPPIVAADEPESAEAGQQYVLLSNDRVTTGKVERDPTGVWLHKRGGKIFYPKDRVLTVANSLVEIYRFKASQVPPSDVSERLKIYEWCMGNNLQEQAEAELNTILFYSPENERALRLKRSFERKREAANAPVTPKDERKERAPTVDPARYIETWRRAYGAELFERYVALEKILHNRCGNAGCHGSVRYEGEFTLHRHRTGHTDQRLTALNLISLQKAIDLKNPNSSPVLYWSIKAEGHVPYHTPPLGGINDPNYKELKEFVFRVAEKWGTETPVLADKPAPAAPIVQPATVIIGSLPNPQGQATAAMPRRPTRPGTMPGDDVPTARPGFGAVADDAPEKPPASSKASKPAPQGQPILDPFDPSGFNALVMPPATTPPSAAEKAETKSGRKTRTTSRKKGTPSTGS